MLKIFQFCLFRKKSDRLEWMYSAPGHSGVNREEYLLGKAIDKAVDPLATNDEKVNHITGIILCVQYILVVFAKFVN